MEKNRGYKEESKRYNVGEIEKHRVDFTEGIEVAIEGDGGEIPTGQT